MTISGDESELVGEIGVMGVIGDTDVNVDGSGSVVGVGGRLGEIVGITSGEAEKTPGNCGVGYCMVLGVVVGPFKSSRNSPPNALTPSGSKRKMPAPLTANANTKAANQKIHSGSGLTGLMRFLGEKVG